jgi:BirA family biotin operon repressor/biotin-[acetyl-CoA-carboxylase] ligase
LKASIKWPNDVLVKTRKVAGILISSAVRGKELEYCVVGAGINLNSKPQRLKRATSLIEHISQSSIPMEPFLASILTLFNNYYHEIQSGNWELVARRWKLNCPMIGKKIKVVGKDIQLDGLATNIDPDGSLILVTSGGQIVKISDTQYTSIKIKP